MLRSHGRASRDWTAEGGCLHMSCAILRRQQQLSCRLPSFEVPVRALRVRQRVDVLDAKFEFA